MKKRSTRRTGGGDWVKGIAIGTGTACAVTVLLSLLFTALTVKQSAWQGMPGYYLAAVPTIALSLLAGLLLGRGSAGSRKNPVSLIIGGAYFLCLLALHTAFSQGTQGGVLTFALCLGIPVAFCILGTDKRSTKRARFSMS